VLSKSLFIILAIALSPLLQFATYDYSFGCPSFFFTIHRICKQAFVEVCREWNNEMHAVSIDLIDLLCLTPLSAIFPLYHGDQS
jgi:hypothetical protein